MVELMLIVIAGNVAEECQVRWLDMVNGMEMGARGANPIVVKSQVRVAFAGDAFEAVRFR